MNCAYLFPENISTAYFYTSQLMWLCSSLPKSPPPQMCLAPNMKNRLYIIKQTFSFSASFTAIFITQYLCWSWEIKCIICIHRKTRRRAYRVINHFLNNHTDLHYGRQDMIPCRFVDGYRSSEGNCSLYAYCLRPLYYIFSLSLPLSIYIYTHTHTHIRLVRYQVVTSKSWNASNGKSAEVGITAHPYMPQRFCLSSNSVLCLSLFRQFPYLKKRFSSDSFVFASAV